MWAGIARMRAYVRQVLDGLPATAGPLDRIDAAVEAHLRHELEISDYTMAAIRNAGQLPETIQSRQLVEANKYGDLWRTLIADASRAGTLRTDLNPLAARMLILGALNWAVEWWNPRRGSLDTLVHTAQSIVRNGLRA
jgi:hypothetical protein